MSMRSGRRSASIGTAKSRPMGPRRIGPMPDRPGFDPYAILGVERDASPLQVARAHRRLAKRFHPDVAPGEGGAERMRRINEAWQILSDRARRVAYDETHPAAGTP